MAMKPSTGRRLAVLAAAAVAVGATLVTTLPAASAAPSTHASSAARMAPPATRGSTYLALGDSIPFAFREPDSVPTPDYTKPQSLIGYPEMVAKALKLNLTNAACPGETTASFLNTSKPSNGCENSPTGAPAYRPNFPLKATYPHSQMRFAVHFLKRHKNTRLVTLMIGANDGLLCLEYGDHCQGQGEMAKVLDTVNKNVSTILGNIRDRAGYTGQIVVVNYYSLDYTNATQNGLARFLNAAVDAAAKQYGAKIAGGFVAWRDAAQQAQGDNCAAGLFTFLQGGGCGIHPSLAGHALLANAVEAKVHTA